MKLKYFSLRLMTGTLYALYRKLNHNVVREHVTTCC